MSKLNVLIWLSNITQMYQNISLTLINTYNYVLIKIFQLARTLGKLSKPMYTRKTKLYGDATYKTQIWNYHSTVTYPCQYPLLGQEKRNEFSIATQICRGKGSTQFQESWVFFSLHY
jgi:hypothetical protein